MTVGRARSRALLDLDAVPDPGGAPPIADPSAVELGTRFRSDVNGFITAIRFYKSAQNTGTHTGSSVDEHRHAARQP